MAFVTSADIVDKLLVNVVTQADLDETQAFLLDFAMSLGVDEANIISPTPFRFKQLGIAYASMIRCKFNSGKLVRDQTLGVEFDPYSEKHILYMKEVNSLKGSITKNMIMVEPESLRASDFSMTIDIFRS